MIAWLTGTSMLLAIVTNLVRFWVASTGVSANSPTYDSGAVFFNAGGDILTFNAPLDLGIFAIYVRLEAAEFDGDFIFEETPNEFIKLHDTNNIRIKIAGGSRHDISSGVELELDTKFNIGFEREDTAATTDDQMFVFIDNVNKAFDGGNGTQDITELLEITTIGKPTDHCKFYEIIICEDALNNTDRASLNTYLNTI